MILFYIIYRGMGHREHLGLSTVQGVKNNHEMFVFFRKAIKKMCIKGLARFIYSTGSQK